MTTQTNLVSMAQQFTGLPMGSLIGGPLNAAANANASMAVTQTQFMLNTCFNKTESKDGGVESYEPIMIKMSLTRGVVTPGQPAGPGGTPAATDPKMETFTTAFDLPILTIIPLNSLAVNTVDINFEMEVKSSYGESQDKSSEKKLAGKASWTAKVGYGPFSASVTGSASYSSVDKSSSNSHYEKSNSAKYTVAVNACQLRLPF